LEIKWAGALHFNLTETIAAPSNRQGMLKTMTPIRTTVLVAISAATLMALTEHARAQTPDRLPPTPDIRCLIVGVTLSNTADSTQRISQAMLALFYFGRLDRFPPKAIGDAIAKEAMTWKPADSQSEADRCGKELIDKAEIMNEAGKNLIHRGMGLDKEGDSPTDAPPEPPPAPALPPIPTPRPRILSHRIPKTSGGGHLRGSPARECGRLHPSHATSLLDRL
jgi:hypothetical protein